MLLHRDVESPIHRLHPATKLVCLPLWFGLALATDRPEVVGGYVLAVVVVATLARAWPSIARVVPLLVMLVVVTTALWTLFGSRGGLAGGPVQGLVVGTRLAAMVVLGVVFLSSTTVEGFAQGLRALGLPYRAAFAITLAFRLVPTFLESGRTVVEAQRARGLDLDRGAPWTRARRYVPVVVPMFLTAIRRADRLSAALETRGFGLPGPRTEYLEHRFAVGDVVALAGSALALVAVVAWLA